MNLADHLRGAVPRETEKHYQATITQLARMMGWLLYHTYDSRRSPEGFPDLVLTREARLVFAEVKRDGEQLRPKQRIWIDRLRKVPFAEVYVWRPADWKTVEYVLTTGADRDAMGRY